MKKKFPGYYKPSDKQFEDLWKKCIFVFDANILLNLYGYSNQTSMEFIKLVKQISERIWITFQVAYEYQKERLGVIYYQEKSYDNALKDIERTKKEFDKMLLSDEQPIVKDGEKLSERLNKTLNEIVLQLKEKKEEYKKININDFIRDEITTLFEEKIGDEYSEEQLKNIYKEGEERYKKRIPPGYKDIEKKEEKLVYADLVLWRQTIDKAKKEKKPIIFITDEKKEDWWWINPKNEIVGPRPELIKEMIQEAGMPFYMYSTENFMERASKYLEKPVNKKAIDEVKEVRKRDEELMKIKTYGRASDILYTSRAEEVARGLATDYLNQIEGLKRGLATTRAEEVARGLATDYLDHIEGLKRGLATDYLNKKEEEKKGLIEDVLKEKEGEKDKDNENGDK